MKAFHVEPGVRRVASGSTTHSTGRCARLARAPRARAGRAMNEVSLEEARRIAVRAQLLDGSATSVARDRARGSASSSSTRSRPSRRRSTSSSGAGSERATTRPSSTACSGRSRSCSSGPPSSGRSRTCRSSSARMRRRREPAARDERAGERVPDGERPLQALSCSASSSDDGPLLSREIAQHATTPRDPHPWWGERQVALMLMILEARGVVAVDGRQNNQRVWDLAERWYPETEKVPLQEAERILAEQRFCALGVRLTRSGRCEAHPERATEPVPDRGDAPLAVRPSDPRPRAGRGALRLLLPARDVRPDRRSASTATTCCRSSSATGSSAAPSRASTARRRRSSCSDAWGDTVEARRAVAELAGWLGATLS